MEDDRLSKTIELAADRLAAGIEQRLSQLAKKERKLRLKADWETVSNMPARLIWDALGDEAPAFFVVYKLIHELRSELPKLFRAIAWMFCSEQPERFGIVTYREQLWDVLATCDEWEEDLTRQIKTETLVGFVQKYFKRRKVRTWFTSRDDDFERDARWVYEKLVADEAFIKGFRSLRHMQIRVQSTITEGNVILSIPKELISVVNSGIVQLEHDTGRRPEEYFLDIARLADNAKVGDENEVVHTESIPFDLLGIDRHDNLFAYCLVRKSANDSAIKEIRRRIWYLRYFLHYAFGSRDVQSVHVAAAFYADRDDSSFGKRDVWFAPGELLRFEEFWGKVTGNDEHHTNEFAVIDQVIRLASQRLASKRISRSLIEMVNNQPLRPPSQGRLFS